MTEPHANTPPHNRDAERGVLGGILRDPDILPDVLAVLRPEAFYFDCHCKILATVADLASRGVPVDLVTLHAELKQRRQMDDVGGVAYLTELWEAVPTGANAIYHAKLVRDAAMIRGLIHTVNEVLRDAHNPTGPAEELVALAERKLYALNDAASEATAEPVAVGELARASLEALNDRASSGATLAGLSTGYPDLDYFLGGLRAGELVVVGARPSLGKTALSLNVAERVARAGTPVLFFSLEMPKNDIADRLLSMDSGVPMAEMGRPRELAQEHIDALYETAMNVLKDRKLYVDDTSDQTAARIAAVSRRQVRRRNVQLIVVDYLQLMRPENPRDNRTQQVGTLALRMKQMARSLNVPVILLSQLNRELEHAKRRPGLADLRESGDIEAHADRVLLLHREPNLPATDPVWPIDVIVAKNRNGPTGEARIAYRRPVLRFENAA